MREVYAYIVREEVLYVTARAYSDLYRINDMFVFCFKNIFEKVNFFMFKIIFKH